MIKVVMVIDFLLVKFGELWGILWSDYILCFGLMGVLIWNGIVDVMVCSFIFIVLFDDDGIFFNFYFRRVVMFEVDLIFFVKIYDFVYFFVFVRNDNLGFNMERRRLDLLNSFFKVIISWLVFEYKIEGIFYEELVFFVYIGVNGYVVEVFCEMVDDFELFSREVIYFRGLVIVCLVMLFLWI